MSQATLEHVNITVTDRHRTAEMLQQLFGWQIRWQGKSGLGGDTIHVGTADHSYIAIYTRPEGAPGKPINGRLNHIGVEVEDLDAAEEKVAAMGFRPHNHGDYEPGRRFYFHDHDGIEYEVVSYA
ncbi:MAG: VOC family protein [Henriciella sp.]|nr:VOC family protein [Henriciella sp.]